MFAVALLVVGVLVVRQVRRATTVPVWVAKSALVAGEPVRADSLIEKRVSKSSMLAGAVTNPSEIIGRVLERPVTEGRAFTRDDFAGRPQPASIAESLPEGRVISTVRIPVISVPTQQLRLGDRFDVISTAVGGEAKIVARDAMLLGWLSGRPPAQQNGRGRLIPPEVFHRQRPPTGTIAFVMAVHPTHAVPIAQAQANPGNATSLVLHGLTEVREGRMLDITPEELAPSREVDLIAGKRREKIELTQ